MSGLWSFLLLAGCLGLPALGGFIVSQPYDGVSNAVSSQVFPGPYDAYAFDRFSLATAHYVTLLSVYGKELGNPAYNTAVVGEIWTGMPDRGGMLAMRASGFQVGSDLFIDFGGQSLLPGDYWACAYVVRPRAGGGQWYWRRTTPFANPEHWLYVPGDGYGFGSYSMPGSSVTGLGYQPRDLAFRLEGSPVPEPGSMALALLAAAGIAGVRRRRTA